MSTQRPSRSPSRRMGLAPIARSLSSTSSTIALTWRSLVAEARTNASVMASCSLTSKATICWASLSEAASAAARTSSRAWSVAVMRDPLGIAGWRSGAGEARDVVGCSLLVLGIEVVLGDVLDDTVRHEVPDRLAAAGAVPAVGGRDRQRGDLDHRHPVRRDRGERRLIHVVAGPGAAHELGEREQLLGVAPGEDLGQRVGSGDEVELRL